jgi:hypothetical protein
VVRNWKRWCEEINEDNKHKHSTLDRKAEKLELESQSPIESDKTSDVVYSSFNCRSRIIVNKLKYSTHEMKTA